MYEKSGQWGKNGYSFLSQMKSSRRETVSEREWFFENIQQALLEGVIFWFLWKEFFAHSNGACWNYWQAFSGVPIPEEEKEMSRDTSWSSAIGAGSQFPTPNQELLARRKAAGEASMAAYAALYAAQERAIAKAREGFSAARKARAELFAANAGWYDRRRGWSRDRDDLRAKDDALRSTMERYEATEEKGEKAIAALRFPQQGIPLAPVLLKGDVETFAAYKAAKEELAAANAAIEADENTRTYLKALDSWAD